MRVGKIMIDTDNMTSDEIGSIINALEAIHARKTRAENYRKQMNHIIERAKAEGFTFIDRECGFVHEVDDFTVFDEKA